MEKIHEAKSYKQRVIQELVPGKQLTLAHIIANPDPALFKAANPQECFETGAMGILTITPPETAIIIADIAIKSAGVKVISISTTSGSLLIGGTVSQIESAILAILSYVQEKLRFEICELTKT